MVMATIILMVNGDKDSNSASAKISYFDRLHTIHLVREGQRCGGGKVGGYMLRLTDEVDNTECAKMLNGL
jgi:hypothetical protein